MLLKVALEIFQQEFRKICVLNSSCVDIFDNQQELELLFGILSFTFRNVSLDLLNLFISLRNLLFHLSNEKTLTVTFSIKYIKLWQSHWRILVLLQ